MVECIDGCYDYFVAPWNISGYQCFIDPQVTLNTPGYGSFVFQSWYQLSQTSGCTTGRNVLFVYTQQYFQEPSAQDLAQAGGNQIYVTLNGGAWSGYVFASLQGATIVTATIIIVENADNGPATAPLGTMAPEYFLEDVPNPSIVACGSDQTYPCPIFFVGLTFLQTAGIGQPLFQFAESSDHQTHLTYVWFYDCTFNGQGAQGGGVIATGSVRNVIFRYNTFINWNYAAVRVSDSIQNSVYQYNTFNLCTGRVLQIDSGLRFRIDNNVFINVRGTADLIGTAMVDVHANYAFACNEAVVSPYGGYDICKIEPQDCLLVATSALVCSFTNNVFIQDTAGADFYDICFRIIETNIPAYRLHDNTCEKAQYGLMLFFPQNISESDVDSLFESNPLIRPSINRASSAGTGYDLIGVQWAGAFYPIVQWRYDFPGSPEAVARFLLGNYSCVANSNYGVATMPAYGDGIPRYGYYQYSLPSQAIAYCIDYQYSVNLAGFNASMSVVHVNTCNGSRLVADNITVGQDIRIVGDDAGCWCDRQGYRPAVYGQGHQLGADRTYIEHMEFVLFALLPSDNLWETSIDNAQNPSDLRITDTIFNGDNVVPTSTSNALLVVMGPILPQDTTGTPPRTDTAPIFTQSYLLITNCSFVNFTSFEPVGGVVSAGFPYTNGIDVAFANQVNTYTTANVSYNYFANIDRAAITLTGAINNTVVGNNVQNCSGRSQGNFCCICITGNPDNTTVSAGVPYWEVNYNNVTQYRDVIYPTSNDRVNIANIAGYYFTAVFNTTIFCFNNNTCLGNLPYAVRITNFIQPALVTCLYPPNNVFFPDALRWLRPLAFQNYCNESQSGNPYVGLNGTVHDLTYGFTGTQLDVHQENLYCDGCCPLVNPTVCFVVQSAILNSPANTWLNVFVFMTINDAINGCMAATRTIIVCGTEDVFDVGDNEPVYYEWFHTTVLPDRQNQTGPVIIQGSPGAIVCSSGNFIDNPYNLSITIEGLYFQHCPQYAPAPNQATWQQNATYQSNHVTLLGNQWDGVGSAQMPITGIFDTPFYFTANLLGNYTGVSGAYFTSRQCNASFVAVTYNTWDGSNGAFPGSSLDVVGYANLNVGNNVFDLVGGADPAAEAWTVRVNPCRYSQPGTLVSIMNNALYANAMACSLSTYTYLGVAVYQTGYWFDPVPSATQGVQIFGNSANGGNCVGMRVLDDDSFVCSRPDPPKYLRTLWWAGNNKAWGQNYDLRWGFSLVVHSSRSLMTFL